MSDDAVPTDPLSRVIRSRTVSRTDEELLDAFADPVRRRTLSYLYSVSRPAVSTAELAERCADAEDADPEDADPEAAERLELALHHTHLPKLDDAGLLDYRAGAREVRGLHEEAVEASVAQLTATLSDVVATERTY
ncbi:MULTISPECIES: DUF7344 domain-containing protein [Haloprofundus]|uniref:DUF7344 domain-containing protein n=1 Tax=Haloprofundus TaxID=1911573 RepID=UPI000E436349|nr:MULTISPECIES: hypothetical protein [Haloprofundus]QCJ46987.1 hypothetical protein FCF25_07625 [Haloprofundus sp. MHR1]